jgi:hypothetical protein
MAVDLNSQKEITVPGIPRYSFGILDKDILSKSELNRRFTISLTDT